ncbi:family 78 glycoside hydrolase catalytic domain [Arthrobacter sp. Sa2CUA1]|uniref:alpha-L-rhamnosidase n=1 Tax=Arthrobacter gallicola TaxID=2762225 RepID=A0ABR8UT32_9MICC|nr:alpha-L-rhamnosidase [Arthrobacter gallicola]MBD7995535.1 family 78 glycoside hydrolase catalytic domain [Arthrobacter gallicola]
MGAHVADLWAEGRRDSPFVAVPRPRLNWIVAEADAAWTARGAEIRLDGEDVAVHTGADHLHVAWPFADILPERKYRVAVRVQDIAGEWTPWSEERLISLGAPATWDAALVGLPNPGRTAQPFIARRVVSVDEEVAAATLYVSGLGAVRAFLDDAPVGDAVLAPGWTSYQERMLLDAIDVTDRVQGDRVVLTLEATGAWYTEEYGFDGDARRVYGEQPLIAAQLVITYTSGRIEAVATGRDWDVRGDGAITSSGLYAGETIDARRNRQWSRVEEGWAAAEVHCPAPRVVTRISEPVREVEVRRPVDVRRTARGTLLLDFGQNFAGRLRLKVAGNAGHEISVRHAEVLEGDELAVRPLRRAEAHDRFVLAGNGEETFEPFGTFHGFRYAEVTGWPGEFEEGAIEAVVLSSDMRRTGWFDSSDPLLNRLHENVVWSTRSNFLSIPTDCPQRDERMGWTGDVAVFAPTALTLFDAAAFLSSWLDDLEIEQQRHGGIVPFVVPDVMGFPPGPAAGWGDAATLVPSAAWWASADVEVLSRRYDSMRTWVEVLHGAAGNSVLWEGSTQFGDWLDPTAPPDAAGAARADRDLVANAYRYRSLCLLAAAAEELGKTDEASRWRADASRLRDAFVRAYVTPDGRMLSDAPTAYVLALRFGLLDDSEMRRAAVDRLVECIRRDGYHIGTGFLGTPHLLDALVDEGRPEVAEALMMQTENPSWLYPVTQGATTVWERWDSLLEDGSINPGEMTSFNHYAFGAVVSWMYRRLAGVAARRPGYAEITFAPVPFHSLDHARVRLETPSGSVAGGWRREGNDIVYLLDVPAHSRAVVNLPGGAEMMAGPGRHEWRRPSHTRAPRPSGGTISLFSPARDIVEDEQAYRAVVGAAGAYGEVGRLFRVRNDWSARSPLAAQLWALPPDASGRIAAALGALAADDPAAGHLQTAGEG